MALIGWIVDAQNWLVGGGWVLNSGRLSKRFKPVTPIHLIQSRAPENIEGAGFSSEFIH